MSKSSLASQRGHRASRIEQIEKVGIRFLYVLKQALGMLTVNQEFARKWRSKLSRNNPSFFLRNGRR